MEVYLGEVDCRRFEELRTQMEELAESINNLTKAVVRNNELAEIIFKDEIEE